MPKDVHIWTKEEALARLPEVLAAARNGAPQRITDDDGFFELTFTSVKKGSAGEYLARGGPGDA